MVAGGFPNLGEDRRNHFAMDVGQTPVETVVVVGDPGVIETQEMEHRGVEVPHSGWLLHGSAAELVSGPVTHSPCDARPHHPAGKAVGIVIPPLGPRLMSGHPPELGGPEDQGVV